MFAMQLASAQSNATHGIISSYIQLGGYDPDDISGEPVWLNLTVPEDETEYRAWNVSVERMSLVGHSAN